MVLRLNPLPYAYVRSTPYLRLLELDAFPSYRQPASLPACLPALSLALSLSPSLPFPVVGCGAASYHICLCLTLFVLSETGRWRAL